MNVTNATQSLELLNRLDRIPFSRWHIKARLILGTATFFDAFDMMTVAFILPVLIDDWRLSLEQVGLLISSVFVGQFVGALFFGWLADRIGRIKSTAMSIAILSGASLACAFAPGYGALLVLRFFQGIGLGGEMPVAATYISEVSQSRWRGRFFLLYELVFPLGLLLAGLVATWVIPHFGWRAMFLLGASPAALIVFLIRTLPESPRWLISKGRFAQAGATISAIEIQAGVGPEGVPAGAKTIETRPADDDAPNPLPDTPSFIGLCRAILSAHYRRRTLVVWVLWLSAFTVNLSLVTWLPSIYKSIFHLSTRGSLEAGLLPNAIQIAAILACALCVDRVGRTTWLSCAYIVSASALMVVGWLTMSPQPALGYIVFIAAFSYAVSGTNCILLYLYTTEIYPTSIRAFGVGTATCCMRIGTAFAPLVIGFLMARFDISTVFYLFAFICVIGAVASMAATETTQSSLSLDAPDWHSAERADDVCRQEEEKEQRQ